MVAHHAERGVATQFERGELKQLYMYAGFTKD